MRMMEGGDGERRRKGEKEQRNVQVSYSAL